MKEIVLPIYGMTVTLDGQGGGTLVSTELKIDEAMPYAKEFNLVMSGVESVILACACAGVDIEDAKFIEAITTSVEAIENNIGL